MTLLKQHKGQQPSSSRGRRVFQENSPLFSTDARGLWEQNVSSLPLSRHAHLQEHLP